MGFIGNMEAPPGLPLMMGEWGGNLLPVPPQQDFACCTQGRQGQCQHSEKLPLYAVMIAQWKAAPTPLATG